MTKNTTSEVVFISNDNDNYDAKSSFVAKMLLDLLFILDVAT